VPRRFAEEIDRLRAALGDKHGGRDPVATLRREIESMAPAILASNSLRQYVACNRAARALTGFNEAELLQRGGADLTPDRHLEDGHQLWTDFIAEGEQHGEYELRRKDGTTVRVRYWAFTNVAPGIHVSVLLP
jgi:PAS domain S-box-containing protein